MADSRSCDTLARRHAEPDTQAERHHYMLVEHRAIVALKVGDGASDASDAVIAAACEQFAFQLGPQASASVRM